MVSTTRQLGSYKDEDGMVCNVWRGQVIQNCLVSIKFCLVQSLQINQYMIEHNGMKWLALECSFHNDLQRSRIKKQVVDLAQICLSDCDFEVGVKSIHYISVLILGSYVFLLRTGVEVVCDWTVDNWTLRTSIPGTAAGEQHSLVYTSIL